MNLFKEILAKIIAKEEINVVFPNLKINAIEIAENESHKSLKKIKNIIEDNTLSDFECVEKIIIVFEDIGSNIKGRHDFG